MWTPKGGFYRKDWSPKPNAKAWLALMRQWRTDAVRKTDAAGRVPLRGFTGRYEAVVGGKRRHFSLPRGGTEVRIDLP
jgi:hypothetical protein